MERVADSRVEMDTGNGAIYLCCPVRGVGLNGLNIYSSLRELQCGNQPASCLVLLKESPDWIEK